MPLSVVLVGALAALGLALAGVRVLVSDWVDRGQLHRRTALEQVEASAQTVGYRTNAWLRRRAVGRWLERETARAGIGLSALELGVVLLVAATTGFLVVRTVAPWWLALAGGYGGVWAVQQWLGRRRQERQDDFVAQLPEFARTLAKATAAGRSLPSALDLAAQELGEPAAGALRHVAERVRLGVSTEDALDELQQRLPSRELAVLVSTLVIQQRSGGDVVTALRDMSETLDARKDLRREIRTIMAGSVSTGYVTAALGIALVFLLERMQPGMVEEMTRSWVGRGALLLAAGLYALGFLLMRRVTDVEV